MLPKKRIADDLPVLPSMPRSLTRRGLLKTMAATSLASLLPSLSWAEDRDARAEARPNIIVMLSDDMGWGQPGFQSGKSISTPNLDRLASEGVNLTQFYVQPVCTPTRSALLTGRYPFCTGTEMRFTPNDTAGMLTDERTLAQALRTAGYRTAICGKWHLGQWQAQHLPLQRGFEHHYGHYSAAIDSFTHMRNGVVLDWHRNGQPVVEEGYSTFLLADETVRLIEGYDKRKPFFIYLPFNAVHGPNQAPPEYVKKYEGTAVRSPKQAAQLECMDIAVGRVLDALDRKKIARNTLVVFVNDNGAPTKFGNKPYRNGKASYLEGGIRVAGLMRWPGRIRSGTVVNEPMHVVDLYPTLVKLGGGSLDQPLPIHGLDIWPTITEGKPTPHKEIVHGLRCLRRGDWKYIAADARYYYWKSSGTQLYNMRLDPTESTNLAAKHPDLVNEMEKRLAWWAKQERKAEHKTKIPGYPVWVYGETENRDASPAVRQYVEQIRKGKRARK